MEQRAARDPDSVCKNCGCKPTCEAHIIPASFLSFAKKGNNHLVTLGLSGSKKAKRQKGLADYNILCINCDQIIGKFDKYAIEFCRGFIAPKDYKNYECIPLPNLDANKIRRFAISVIWRASISQLSDMGNVKLGPFEDKARDLIFGDEDLDQCNSLHIQISFLTDEHGLASQMVTYPIRCRNENGVCFIFLAGGFQFLVRFGSKPIASEKHLQFAKILAIRSDQQPQGVKYPFDEAGEFEIVRLAAAEDVRRKQLK